MISHNFGLRHPNSPYFAGALLDANHVRVLFDLGELGEQMGFVVVPLPHQKSVALTRNVERAKLQNALR